MLILIGVMLLIDREAGMRAVDTTRYSLREMILILPPIFVLLGLLDVWVERAMMVRFLGEDEIRSIYARAEASESG